MATKSTVEERLKKLDEQKQKLLNQQRQKAAAVKNKERKQDARRNFLAGSIILNHPPLKDELMRLLDEKLVKPADRALFDLAPLPETVSGITDAIKQADTKAEAPAEPSAETEQSTAADSTADATAAETGDQAEAKPAETTDTPAEAPKRSRTKKSE
jgi:hypothetical protein